MACQVEVMTGNDIERGGKSHLSSECDLEMTSLQTLKEKYLNGNENVNGNESDNFEKAGSSNVISNGNDLTENGHDKVDTDSDVNGELALTPKKSAKAKKGKKEKIVSKSTRHTPSKKKELEEESTVLWQDFALDKKDNISNADSIDVENDVDDLEDNFEVELTPKKGQTKKGKREMISPKPYRRNPKKIHTIEVESLENIEIDCKNDDDDESTIDVGNDESIEVVEDDDLLEKQELEKSSEEQVKECEGSDTVFARLRNSMRFSISPKKQPENTVREHSLRVVSGRRALHQTPPSTSFQPTATRKRKSEIEGSDTPHKKCFITTFSEHSPGWKFFSSPFHKLWTSNESETEAASSTPMRKLHEDMESMVVNTSGTIVGNLLQVDDLQVTTGEKINIDEKPELQDPQSNWKCIVM